jgi:hypothetical protein
MKNKSLDSLQLLVLVPHRDVRRPLRAFSASLFSDGLPGAWSFPWVVPVAALNRPLSDAQLKNRALLLRSAAGLSGGKFTTGQPAVAALSDNVFVFGPTVNIELPDSFFAFEDNAVSGRVSPYVIGAALCQSHSPPLSGPPVISFRAAALANMSFRPLLSDSVTRNDFSFEWEIGKLYWLPRVNPDRQH